MTFVLLRDKKWAVSALAVITIVLTAQVQAENCQTATDMDAATRSALTSAGQRYFDMIMKGDTASLRQSAIPSLASDFSGIEGTVKDHQKALAGSHSTLRPPFLLEADGTAAIAHAEFFCGVFGKSEIPPQPAREQLTSHFRAGFPGEIPMPRGSSARACSQPGVA